MAKNGIEKHNFLFIHLIILFCSLSIFYTGFHNIDICANLMVLNSKENLNYYETNLKGEFISPINCYRSGLKYILFGLAGTFCSTLLIGKYLK